MRKSREVTAVTKTSILKAAAKLIRTVGFEATTVDAVMKGAGLTHGGFYRHFASLGSLLVEGYRVAVEDGLASTSSMATSLAHAGLSPVAAFIETCLSRDPKVQAETLCTLSSVASEVPRQSPEIQQIAEAEIRAICNEVAARLPGEHTPADAAVIAAELLGAIQLARVMRHGAGGDAIVDAIRADLLRRFDKPASTSNSHPQHD